MRLNVLATSLSAVTSISWQRNSRTDYFYFNILNCQQTDHEVNFKFGGGGGDFVIQRHKTLVSFSYLHCADNPQSFNSREIPVTMRPYCE